MSILLRVQQYVASRPFLWSLAQGNVQTVCSKPQTLLTLAGL